jgi:hypothetical protein
MSEKGSDDQMTDEQREELQRRLELERAMVLEEERKTAAVQPAEPAA